MRHRVNGLLSRPLPDCLVLIESRQHRQAKFNGLGLALGEMEAGDLRGCIEPDGGFGGPKAAIDIQVGSSETIQALGVRAQQVSRAEVEAEQARLDLPAIVVT